MTVLTKEILENSILTPEEYMEKRYYGPRIVEHRLFPPRDEEIQPYADVDGSAAGELDLTRELEHKKIIFGPYDSDQIDGASIEPRVGERIWQIPARPSGFYSQEDWEEWLETYGERIEPDDIVDLGPNTLYAIQIAEQFGIREPLTAQSDTRSTVARIGVDAYVTGIDNAHFHPGNGVSQPYMIVATSDLPIRLRPYETRLAQFRIRDKRQSHYISQEELQDMYGEYFHLEKEGEFLPFKEIECEESGVVLHVKTDYAFTPKEVDPAEVAPIDVMMADQYDPADYFDVQLPTQENGKQQLWLMGTGVYLLGLQESVHFSPHYAGDLMRENRRTGYHVGTNLAGWVKPNYHGGIVTEHNIRRPIDSIALAENSAGVVLLPERVMPPSASESTYTGQTVPALSKVFNSKLTDRWYAAQSLPHT